MQCRITTTRIKLSKCSNLFLIKFSIDRNVWSCGFSKKIGEDKEIWRDDDESTLWKKNKDRHLATDRSLYCWYNFLMNRSQKQEGIKWLFRIDQRKIYCLTNRILSTNKEGKVSIIAIFKSLFITPSVLNWIPLFKSSKLSFVTFSRTYREDSHDWPFVVGHIARHQFHK